MRIADLMNEIALRRNSFKIELDGIDKFAKRGEVLYWCGIKEIEDLKVLQDSFVKRLKDYEFYVDDKPFKPHITLARRCIMDPDFDKKKFSETIKPMIMKVTKIHLMRSEHKEGKLIYSSLGEVRLHG